MTFEYRILTPDEADAWQALRLKAVREFPMGFLITETEAAASGPDRCRTILSHGKQRGVFDGTTLIGVCGYCPGELERIRHRAEIGPFYVDGAYHGTGAADCLMKGVIGEALSSDTLEWLDLYVDIENHRAIRFYERLGFQKQFTFPDGCRIDGVARDAYFYTLNVSESAGR